MPRIIIDNHFQIKEFKAPEYINKTELVQASHRKSNGQVDESMRSTHALIGTQSRIQKAAPQDNDWHDIEMEGGDF